ncbi:MAG: response regulator [Candidatus Dormibacteraeota bacterium]|nr:response regulator [Candidatus Dormibacteraeota bacterium]
MPSTGGPRVLIVEDDASLLRLLELRLSVDGYTTRTAADGVAALQELARWLPDVVLTDVMMPRLSGLSLCRAIRRDRRTATVPIILLTARCFDNDMQDVVDLGGVTFMNKPFDAESLNAALLAAVAGRPAPATGMGAPHAA